MGLKSIKRALRQELRAEKSRIPYEKSRRRHEELKEHETPFSVLAVLADSSASRWKEKDAKELIEMGDPEEPTQSQHLRWPETSPIKSEKADVKEQARMTAFLVERVGADIEEDRLDQLIAPQVRGEMLSRYVARLYPELKPAELRRAYQRIKRRHSRALVKLRKLLDEAVCPL